MPLEKQPFNLNFAQGMDQKTDPKAIPFGKFTSLVNRIFNNTGLLTKRNGFGEITSLDNASSLTTFQDGLVTIGTSELQAYSPEANLSIDAGFIQPLSLEVLPLVRSASSQVSVDMAIASNGLACSTWLDSNGNSYYQITDTSNGQIVQAYVQLPATATNSRVFILGQFFIVTYLATVSAAAHLQYIAIPIVNVTTPNAPVDIATNASSLSAAYDGNVANGFLYIAWNRSATIGVTTLNTSLQLSTPITINGNTGSLMSVVTDVTGGAAVVWITWFDAAANLIKTTAYNNVLSATPILAPTTVVSGHICTELTSTAYGNVLHVFYEVFNTYTFTPNAKTDYIAKNTCTLAGVVGSPTIILRNVGLGSKAVYSASNNTNYMLAVYGQTFQPSYYLIDDSGRVLSKFAYSNGGGYLVNQILPQMTLNNNKIQVSYLFKDFIQAENTAVNKIQGSANPDGIYANTGINLITFTLGGFTQGVEIAQGLHLNGGFLWQYDGVKPVEHSFFVWPEDIQATWSTTGGAIHAQPDGTTNNNAYFYQVTYEWTDAQGLVHRSAPSVPFAITTTGSGTTGSVVLNLPTLRQTYKTTNKVRIIIYRWSIAQQNYYQITSVQTPLLNDPTVDSVTFTDTLADSSILGNALIYTTGGVIENIGAPSFKSLTLFDDRLWGISAEDGLLWFSKQVIQSTPVEMSDLLTYYIAPTIGASGSTGLPECLFPMDDKMVVFKANACYFFNGSGPDNTGANSQYSQPIFITSTVGCSNQQSIVFIPNGLMFQSQNGIWLLGRGLNTEYIGKEVQGFNEQTVTSAITIPGATHVRFTLNNRVALMYDYYYEQWGTFSNINAIASTLYQGLHTYLDPYGRILQETPGLYLDVSTPVLTSFVTSWINMASLQGYQRFYYFYLLGQYITPHTLTVGIAYDYGPSPSQQITINPINFSGVYGSDPLYGDSIAYGGVTQVEQWRVFPQQQKCQSFQLTINEIYDPSFGVPAGAGLSISGLNMIIGIKRGSRPIPARSSAG